MAQKHKMIKIQVSQRILWFDETAYSLRQITRVQANTLIPKTRVMIQRSIASVAPWIIITGVIVKLTPEYVGVPAIVGALIYIAYKTVDLTTSLKKRLSELVIETAAGSHRALITDNHKQVKDLATRITTAINNPAAEFQMQIDNFHLGDNIDMSGDHNVGKQVQ